METQLKVFFFIVELRTSQSTEYHVESVAMERKNYLSFALLFTYSCCCQQYKVYLILRVKFPVFLSNNHVLIFSNYFNTGL
jgi:hypothetical protein